MQECVRNTEVYFVRQMSANPSGDSHEILLCG